MGKQLNILAVDDEKIMLERLCRCIKEADEDAKVVAFRNSTDALNYFKENAIDIAFLDIQMRKMTGMELAREMKLIRPMTNIIFVTGYNEYIFEAVADIRCSGYLLKPVTAKQVANELENLRNPIETKTPSGLQVQCFGNVEVFADGKAVNFASAKTK